MRKTILVWGLYAEVSEGAHVGNDLEEGECLLVAGASYCLDGCTHCTSATDSCSAVDQDYFFVVDGLD